MLGKDVILVVIDFQKRIAKHIDEIENIKRNLLKLIKSFQIFNLPIIYTKQINLGKIIFKVDGIEKKTFSCWKEEKFVEKMKDIGYNKVILTGIETHICIFQTAIDMKNAGYDVYIPVDCTGSRKNNDKEIAIERMKQEGIKLTSAEMLIYEILQSADSKEFKKILKIVKE